MSKVGRNELCPCGSGKKYKNCHQNIDNNKGPGNKQLIIGGIIALVILFFAIGLYFSSQSSRNTAPGDAPEGKVWSEEHGHWHDVE